MRCWALTRAVRPDLPGDPKHPVTEPSLAEISAALERHGLAGERELWWTDYLRASEPAAQPANVPRHG